MPNPRGMRQRTKDKLITLAKEYVTKHQGATMQMLREELPISNAWPVRDILVESEEFYVIEAWTCTFYTDYEMYLRALELTQHDIEEREDRISIDIGQRNKLVIYQHQARKIRDALNKILGATE